jgi:hypothetical protein
VDAVSLLTRPCGWDLVPSSRAIARAVWRLGTAAAIVCGLAVLFCGPFLLGHSLLRWAQRGTAPAR